MRRVQPASRNAIGWIVLILLVTGCDVSSMAFVEDKRVRIEQPTDRSIVTIPVTLRWEVDGFEITGRDAQKRPDAGYFAVFVDRQPIPPGKTLEWYARQDESCGDNPCGTVEDLAQIFTSDKASLKLTQLPAIRERGDLEQHEVVIVLMDGTGARIGESAFRVQFNFERKA